MAKREIWLHRNRRVAALGLAPPALLILAGALAALLSGGAPLWLMPGIVVMAAGIIWALVVLWRLQTPRMAFDGECLLVYLKAGKPHRVPIEVVECFFFGQGDSTVTAPDGSDIKAANIVVRLAESAKEWHERDASPALGKWSDGYIILRGLWCQPINAELLERLNKRLVEANRSAANRKAEAVR